MVWTDITRRQYERKCGRYASDCTDEEWALVEPFLPASKPTGRPRTSNLRDIWDAIQYMASSGCQWHMIPNDFPPRSTVQRYFYEWRECGLFHRINHALVMQAREQGITVTVYLTPKINKPTTMTRIARLVVTGLPHHVTQRGNRMYKTIIKGLSRLSP